MPAPEPIYRDAILDEFTAAGKVFDASPTTFDTEQCLIVAPWCGGSRWFNRNGYGFQTPVEFEGSGPSESQFRIRGGSGISEHVGIEVQEFPGATLKDQGVFHPSGWTASNTFHDHPWGGAKVFDPNHTLVVCCGFLSSNTNSQSMFFTFEQRANELRVFVGELGTLNAGFMVYYQAIEVPWIDVSILPMSISVDVVDYENTALVVPQYVQNKTIMIPQGAGTPVGSGIYHWQNHQFKAKPGATDTTAHIRAQRIGSVDISIGRLAIATIDEPEVAQVHQDFYSPVFQSGSETVSDPINVPSSDLSRTVFASWGLHAISDMWGDVPDTSWANYAMFPDWVVSGQVRYLRNDQTSAPFYQIDVPFSFLEAQDAGAGAVISGDVSLGMQPAAALAFAREITLSGDVPFGLTPAANLSVTRERSISGDVPLGLIPSAAFSAGRTLSGDVTHQLLPSAGLSFGSQLNGDVTLSLAVAASLAVERLLLGDVTLALVPAASLLFSTGESIQGAVTLDLSPNADLAVERAYSIDGDVPFQLVPSAILDFTGAAMINGDVTHDLLPAANTEVGRVLLGDVPLALVPSAQFDFGFSISGDVDLGMIPGAGLSIGRAISGDVPLALIPAAAFGKGLSLSGDVTHSLTPAAVMLAIETFILDGDVTFTLTPAANMQFALAIEFVQGNDFVWRPDPVSSVWIPRRRQ